MKILDSSKSLSVLVNDLSNGLGTIQPLECTVTEELNGIYECEFTVLTTDKHYEDLKNSGLIKVTVGDGSGQIFRVYFISEPINFVVTVKAQHISYDLSKIVVKPFTATGAVNVKNQLVSHILGNYPFSTWTNITNTTSTFTLDIPRSFRECLGGYEGSVLDVFRCEYEWDNLTVKMYARRGADNGVRIAYGKNLTDFVQEQNNENVYDGVYGYAVVDEVTYQASNYYNKTGATTPKILNVDFSSDYETGQVPTAAELLSKATTYAQNNPIEVPSVNIKIDFVPLWQTEEYKDILQLERVSLGDTVHVFFDKLNVEASARVIKTVWNVLTNKYDSVELGDARANMNTIINQSVQQAVEEMDVDVGWLDEKLNTMTTLIANGLGLHISQDEAGRITLHNAETIADSQYQYMITSSGFMLSDDYGQSWSSGWTTSGDAVLNSLSTITLRALEIYGSYIQGSQIVFGDPSVSTNKYIIAQPYSNGVTFDGTGTIRLQPQEAFYINNKAVNSSSNYNYISMMRSGSNNQGLIQLVNNDDLHNYATANFIYLNSHTGSDQGTNTLGVVNYATHTGTQYYANSFSLTANATNNIASFGNRKLNSDQLANIFSLTATSTTNSFYFTNYFVSSNVSANTFNMNTTSTASNVYIRNTNMNASASTNWANYLNMVTDTSGANKILIYNQDTSGSPCNYISMTASDMMMHVWSRSDLFLESHGAVRLQSGNSQDITLTASDDVYITASDKIYLNSNQIYFSDGYVRYYT